MKIHKYSPGLKRGWEVVCQCKSKKQMFEIYHTLKFKLNIPMNYIHLRKIGKIADEVPYEIWLKDKHDFNEQLNSSEELKRLKK